MEIPSLFSLIDFDDVLPVWEEKRLEYLVLVPNTQILDSLELWINLTILKSIKSQRFKNEISFYYARKIDIDLNIFKLGKNFSDQNG